MHTMAIEEAGVQATQQFLNNEDELCYQVLASVQGTCQQANKQTKAHLKALEEP